MKVFVYVFILSCFVLAKQGYGQTVTVMEENGWGVDNTLQDTMWYVNYEYTSAVTQVKLKLLFPNDPTLLGEANKMKVDWGDGNSVENVNIDGNPRTKTYEEGKYDIKIELYKDNTYIKTLYRFLFNQKLQAKATILEKWKGFKYPISGCMENGVDTVMVCLTEYDKNPPGTKYDVKVVDGIGYEIKYWNENVRDTAYVIFKEPNGSSERTGSSISYVMKYTKPGANRPFITESIPATTYPIGNSSKIEVQAKPNLRKIFGFVDTLPADPLKHIIIDVCSGSAPDPSKIAYNESVNQRYYDSNGKPDYRLFWNFKAQYYRKDSFAQLAWEELPSNTTAVDTTREEENDLKFYESGLYRIRFEAHNTCGGDTLFTDSIPNFPQRTRYFKVAQSGEGNIFSFKDTSCLSGTTPVDTIVFVDRGKRLALDFYPRYGFEITGHLPGKDGKDSVFVSKLDTMGQGTENVAFFEQKTYLGTQVLPDNQLDMSASDSVVLKLAFKRVGNYGIKLFRSIGTCDTVTYTDSLIVGMKPRFTNHNLLLADFGNNPPKQNGTIDLCTKFTYKFPDNLGIDYRNMKPGLDSAVWLFKKGTKKDITRPSSGQYDFDSLGDVRNYMQVVARNYCGNDTLSVDFYTRVQPKVSLWRDSVQNNDTLCLNFRYNYFFKDTLPATYTINASFSEDVDSANVKKKEFILKNDSVFRNLMHIKSGATTETYVIKNSKNEACRQTLVQQNVLIVQPDSLYYKDTVFHCESFLDINSKKLFNGKDSTFKRIEWTLNGGLIGATPDNPWPDILLRGNDKDTLSVKISNSTGCYINQKLFFTPKPEPAWEVVSGVPVTNNLYSMVSCAPDTILYKELVTMNAEKADSIVVTVRQKKGKGSELLYGMDGASKVDKLLVVKSSALTPFYIHYALENKKVTPGFGNCTKVDSIMVNVSKPKLKISFPDTLRDNRSGSYTFPEAYLKSKIDTAQITIETDCWTPVNPPMQGSFSSNSGLFGSTYTIHNDDRLLDSLVFELKGETVCGGTLKDTLAVYIPVGKLFAHKDTICEDADYRLWGAHRTWGEFIDTATLNWKIVENKGGGTFVGGNAGKGASVRYIPAPADTGLDTVKILVEGNILFNDTEIRRDTIYLWVNPKPVTTFPDTLFIGDGTEMIVNKIPAAKRKVEHSEAIEWVTFPPEWGRWENPTDMNRAKFIWVRMAVASEVSVPIGIKMTGKKGCTNRGEGTYIDTMLVWRSKAPGWEFKNTGFDLCKGDSIRIDTSFRITDRATSKGKFVLSWKNDPENVGKFNRDSSWYIWKEGMPASTSLSLGVNKRILLYTDEWTTIQDTLRKNMPVTVYVEPNFMVSPKYDTLCLTQTNVNLSDKIKVEPSVYQNLLKYDRSVGLGGNYPNFTVDASLNQAKLVAYVDQGGCKKWINKTDTLHIGRLPKMQAGFEFVGDSKVCENGAIQIENVSVDPLARKFYWGAVMSDGLPGSVVDTNGGHALSPVFRPNGYHGGGGKVSLTVEPPVDRCVNTDKVTVYKNITVIGKPDIRLQKQDTVCKSEVSYTINFADHSSTKQIEWFTNDNPIPFATTGPGVSSVRLSNLLDNSIEISGKKERLIKIKAKITLVEPCLDIVEESLSLVLWDFPMIQMLSSLPQRCLGDTLILDFATIENSHRVAWSSDRSGIFGNMNKLETTYLPNEFAGSHRLTLTALGEHGCGQTTSTTTVEFKAIPKPDFIVNTTPICAKSEVVFTNTSTPDVPGTTWAWKTENLLGAQKDFKHTYAAAGTYDVRLQAKNGVCSREVIHQVVINPLPVPDFIVPDRGILGVNIPYNFYNGTTGTNSYTWKFGDGTVYTNTLNATHTFVNSYAEVDINLIVTNRFHCIDSITHLVQVVDKPNVEFRIEADSCKGETKFVNLSSEDPSTKWGWNLGNGSFSQEKEPQLKYAISDYNDTVYYVTLKVINAAAPEGITITDSVKMISNLKAILKPSGGVECQSPVDVYIHSGLSQGRADSYRINWGDGSADWTKNTLPGKNIIHSYVNDTEDVHYYKVRLTVENACHLDSAKLDVTIRPNVVQAAITADKTTICFGEEVTFENLSKGFDNNNVQTQWYFEGDKDPETHHGASQYVKHFFHTPGKYEVRLRADDNCNGNMSVPVIIMVGGDQSLTFDATGTFCSAQEMKMKVPDSLMMPARFFNYKWEFGDDSVNFKNVSSVAHKYVKEGNYIATLTATAYGTTCKTVANRAIRINRTPVARIAKWSDVTGCAPLMIKLEGNGGLGQDDTWWDFGDGNQDQRTEIVEHTYPKDGPYKVAFKIRSPEGCVDSSFVDVLVKPTPRPVFDLLSDRLFCTPDGRIKLDLRNTTPLMGESTYKWYYSAQTEPFSMEMQPPMYAANGVFGELELKLVATNKESGCVATYRDSIVSSHSVEAKLLINPDSVHNACETVPVKFVSVSRYGNRLSWDLGDGSVLQRDSVFVHAYDRPAEYEIKLKAENEYGCTDNATHIVTVYPLPDVQFIYEKDNRILPEDGLPQDVISHLPEVDNGGYLFTNQSSVAYYVFADNQRLYTKWDLGDTITTEDSPFHRFKNNGNYKVTLYATTMYGCIDSVSDNIKVGAVKGLFIPTAFAPADTREEVNRFQPKGIGLSSYKMQIYDMWGTCVWTSTKLDKGRPAEYWDGTIDGAPAEKATYIWKVSAIFLDGSVWNGKSGGLMLIR